MDSKHLVSLFDVKSTLNSQGWSPNVWRTRFVLNYKGIPYETQWIHFSEVEQALRAADIPPSGTQKPQYTVPAIVDRCPSGTKALSDSTIIADYLENEYPEPSIFPGDTKAIQKEIIDATFQHIVLNMAFMVISNTANILDERDAAHFISSRKAIFGVAVEDMFPEAKRNEVWDKLEKGFNTLAGVIAEKGRGGGVWIFGDNPTYADFVLVAQFIWVQKAGPQGAWDRIKVWNEGRWEAMYKRAERYMKVD